MSAELFNIETDEVSLVDRGANGRRLLVKKRAQQRVEFTKQLDALKALAGDRIQLIANELAIIAQFETLPESAIWDAFWRLHETAWAAEWDVLPLARAAGAPDDLVDKIETNMEATVADEEVEKVEFTDDDKAAMEAFAAGEATEEQLAVAMKLAAQALDNGGLYPKPEAVEQQEDDADEEESTDDDEEEIEMKDEEVAKRASDVAANFAKREEALNLKLEAVEKRLQIETDKREVAEHIEKARKWPNLFAAVDAGPIMKSIHGKLDADEYKWLEARLTESQEFAKMGNAFGEVGSQGGNNDDGDAAEKLDTIAKRIVTDAKTAGQRVSYAKAHVQAVQDNPDLFKELHSTPREA